MFDGLEDFFTGLRPDLTLSVDEIIPTDDKATGGLLVFFSIPLFNTRGSQGFIGGIRHEDRRQRSEDKQIGQIRRHIFYYIS